MVNIFNSRKEETEHTSQQRIKCNREYDILLRGFIFSRAKEDLLQTGNKSGFNNCVYWRPVFTKNCEIEMKRDH